MNNKKEQLSSLIQIRPSWHHPRNFGKDVNIWSRVHPRFDCHDGCIVDLGCLGWNKKFEDKTSDNWSGYFFNKKRVIGVDPQEHPNRHAEFFKGFISNFSGKGNLTSSGLKARLVPCVSGQYDVLTWKDFKILFNINSISILKINIEGGEWDLIESFDSDDFLSIDQICVSFHNFVPMFKKKIYTEKTKKCITKIVENNYNMIDLDIYGWKIFLKK